MAEERTVPSDLERRVGRLEQRFDQVSERATRREEDFGSVRSQASRVPEFLEELRGLKRLVDEQKREIERLTRQLERRPPAPVIAEAVGPESRPGVRPITQVTQAPSTEQVRAWVSDEVRTALADLDVKQLIGSVYPDLGQRTGELTQALRRLGIEVDAETVISVILEQLWQRLDLDRVYEAVAGQLTQLARRRM